MSVARDYGLSTESSPANWIEQSPRPDLWIEKGHGRSPNRNSLAVILNVLKRETESVPPGNRAAVDSARAILSDIWQTLKNRSASLAPPLISVFEDGAIDFFWKTRASRVLLHIKPDGASDFSAKTTTGLKASGEAARNLHAVAEWLSR